MKKILFVLLLNASMSPAWAMDIPAAGSAGGKLFAQRCATCHALPHPKRLDWMHWRHMLALMKQRMDEKDMSMPKEEWQQISAYLKRNANP